MEFHGFPEVVVILSLALVCVTADASQTRKPRGLFRYRLSPGYGKRLAIPASNINRIPYRPVDYGLERGYTLDPSEADETIVNEGNEISRLQPDYPWYKNQERKIPSSEVMSDYFPLFKLLNQQRDETSKRNAGRPAYA